MTNKKRLKLRYAHCADSTGKGIGSMQKVLVIIPAYNEGKNIGNVVTQLRSACPDYDYIIMNDCSKDGTEQICRENGFHYVSLPINLGIGGNVQTGYRYAKKHGYDIAVQLDGDGQHDPSQLKSLITLIENGQAHMVIGSRFIRREGFQSSFLRRVGIRFFEKLIRLLCRQTIADATSGFRACSRDLIDFFAEDYAQDYPEPEAVISAIRAGFKVTEVPVVMKERKTGVSSISSLKSIYYMIKVSLAMLISAIKPWKRR